MISMAHPENWRTEKGATDLAYRIREYWLKRGYEVRTTVRQEPNPIRGNAYDGKPCSAWAVRSDMINGWPIRKAAKEIEP